MTVVEHKERGSCPILFEGLRPGEGVRLFTNGPSPPGSWSISAKVIHFDQLPIE